MATQSWLKQNREIIVGLLLLFIGTLLFLNNVDIIDIGSAWRVWPFIIVAFGLYKLLRTEHPREVGGGFWLVFFGLWLFVSLNHIFGLGFSDTWPILVIGWGIKILWRAFPRPSQYILAEENRDGN